MFALSSNRQRLHCPELTSACLQLSHKWGCAKDGESKNSSSGALVEYRTRDGDEIEPRVCLYTRVDGTGNFDPVTNTVIPEVRWSCRKAGAGKPCRLSVLDKMADRTRTYGAVQEAYIKPKGSWITCSEEVCSSQSWKWGLCKCVQCHACQLFVVIFI